MKKSPDREAAEQYLQKVTPSTSSWSRDQNLLLAIAHTLLSIDNHLFQLASPTKISFQHTKHEEQ